MRPFISNTFGSRRVCITHRFFVFPTFHQVFTVSKDLVPRVLSRVVEAVSEELSRLMQCVSSFSRNGALQVPCRCCARGPSCLNHGDVCQLQSQEVRTGFVLSSRWLCQLRGASSPGTASRTSVVPELLSLESVAVLVCRSEGRALLHLSSIFVVCFTDVFTTFNLIGNFWQLTCK